MPRFLPEPALPFAQQHRTAVLLLNLGTPAAPTAAAVRPYLREFLSDPRVVELPKWLWQPILRGLVLTLRPKKSAHGYEKVWLPKARRWLYLPSARPPRWRTSCPKISSCATP